MIINIKLRQHGIYKIFLVRFTNLSFQSLRSITLPQTTTLLYTFYYICMLTATTLTATDYFTGPSFIFHIRAGFYLAVN